MRICHVRFAVLAVAALAVSAAACTNSATVRAQPRARAAAAGVTPMTLISTCGGGNAEAEEAFAPPGYVYADWIGCGGIGFARSADGGRHFSRAVTVPGSRAGAWDPAVAVAPDGAVYLSFMQATGKAGAPHTIMYPVVATSHDHGASFAVHPVFPPHPGNWGDRDFIAAGRHGMVYLTWDYGPSGAAVTLLCAPSGSCAYSNGDFNAVIQVSADGGRTFGPVTHLEPGFPHGGGYLAPLVVRPDGQVSVLSVVHPTDPGTLKVHPGYEYVTSSPDGVHWPARPARLWPAAGTVSVPEWWIDGDISTDSAGNLYATWDTQTAAGDIGWLSASRDGGRTWSPPVRVTPDRDNAPHIVQSAGGHAGIAYVAWLTSASPHGYALWLRPYSVTHGWLAPAIRVSARYGAPGVWPGDTFGIAALPGGQVSLTWGSAIGAATRAEIYAAVVTVR